MPPPSKKPGVTIAGVIVGFAGFVLATYAWTGPRAYEFVYLYAALGGAVLMVGGVGVAGYGRAMGGSKRRARGRTGKAKRAAAASKAKRSTQPAKASKPAAAKVETKKKPRLVALRRKARNGGVSLEAEEGELWPASARSNGGGAAAPEPAAEPEAAPKKRRLLPVKGKKTEATNGRKRRLKRSKKPVEVTVSKDAATLEAKSGELWPTSLRPQPEGGVNGNGHRFDLRCPDCAGEFEAEGVPPLAIRCPRCGVEGMVA